MNNGTVQNILRLDQRTSRMFEGIYPVDALPARVKFPSYIIVNTSKSTVHDGHWVVIYFKNFDDVIFFDSFGRSPTNVNNGRVLKMYLDKYNVKFNEFVLQSKFSSVCGYYCLYVAFYLCRGVFFFKDMFCMFTKDVDYNDGLIIQETKRLYKTRILLY